MEEKSAVPKFADRILALCEERVTLFHAADGAAYADIVDNGKRQTWRVKSSPFRQWLMRAVYMDARTAAPTDAMNAAIGILEAKARFDGPMLPVCVRVGGYADKIYLDLCDADWRAVEIDEDGWRITTRPPVRFRRSAGMLPLPTPQRGLGGVDRLRPLLNLDGSDGWALVVAWLVAALRDRGPYPMIAMSAEQGSGKSMASRMLRNLIDPNAAPLRNLPREERDLFITATNGHVLAFDNVSTIQPWQSDALCRLSTGGGAAYRKLYEDAEEAIFEASRPIILNGIEDFLTRADAADRAIVLNLPTIPESRRDPESKILREFEAARPGVLCDLLDMVADGLANLPNTQLAALPRMADFAIWATACEGGAGSFIGAYAENRKSAIENVVDADPVSAFIVSIIDRDGQWAGTAGDLLAAMESTSTPNQKAARNFPKTPKAVSAAITRNKPFLRKLGLDFPTRPREGRAGRRVIEIVRTNSPLADVGTTSAEPSASTVTAKFNALLADGSAGADDCVPTPASFICRRCDGEGCGWCPDAEALR